MAESQKRKADDSATDASQFSFEAAYKGDYPPELLKELDNPPDLSKQPENAVYLVQHDEEGSYNMTSFATRGVFTSLSLANQQALKIFLEEHLEFFEGDDWSHFVQTKGNPNKGTISWKISEIGELKLHGLPEPQEYDEFNEWRVYVQRQVILSELPPSRHEEYLKRRKL